ncbi:hypothetical protein MRX96_028610 [Rhipicephalus microplus]
MRRGQHVEAEGSWLRTRCCDVPPRAHDIAKLQEPAARARRIRPNEALGRLRRGVSPFGSRASRAPLARAAAPARSGTLFHTRVRSAFFGGEVTGSAPSSRWRQARAFSFRSFASRAVPFRTRCTET